MPGHKKSGIASTGFSRKQELTGSLNMLPEKDNIKVQANGYGRNQNGR